jgi:hypothetical protein
MKRTMTTTKASFEMAATVESEVSKLFFCVSVFFIV